jgi:hypothetical protein
MAIAALVTFGILVVAWIVAPDQDRRRSKPAPDLTPAEAPSPA